jgi:membrane-associated protein
MTEAILQAVHDVLTSPWFFLVLFALATVDAFFPIVPSESVVITAGVFAATGEPNLFLVIGVAALGAFVGDHVSYAIGRRAGGRLAARIPAGGKRRAAHDWAARELGVRGGLVLVVARYIPGGRTAVTLTTGTVGYPLRRFSFFAAIAALSWAVYSGLIGFFGGLAFEADPLKGLLFGIGLAVGITVVVEVVRHVRRKRRLGSAPSVELNRVQS